MRQSDEAMNWKGKLLVGVAAVVIIGVTIALLQVDDWSRDLTDWRAATQEEADDELLRPISVSLPVERVSELVRETAMQLPRWSSLNEDSRDDSLHTMTFQRRRWLVGIVDTITVSLNEDEASDTTIVEVFSESEVHWGDLGQNPRNIKELSSELRAKLLAAGLKAAKNSD